MIALTGPLGSGKTCLAKGIAIGLDIDPRDVTSPTFLLIHELDGRLPLRHVDAYRVAGARELTELGADELFTGGGGAARPVVLVEWADRVPGLLPGDRLEVVLAHAGEAARTLTLLARGTRHARLLEALEGEGAS
jgi:tRNA threonylcarbamoyladenosine biosynthesis protein TsaE